MKNKISKGFLFTALAVTILTSLIVGYAPTIANNYSSADTSKIAAATQTPAKPTTTASTAGYITVDPLDLVANPSSYLNKNVKFKATFDKYSTLGLDYKPAMKSSEEYIGILIKKSNVKDHTIPLSELKMFLDRKTAEKHIDIESGDIIEIEGNVFSTALGDPWVNIKKFTIVEQVNKENKDKK